MTGLLLRKFVRNYENTGDPAVRDAVGRLSGIVGILFGTAGSVILSTLLMQMTIFPPVKVTVGAFALSVALGIIFGSYPAAKA